jgi:hypothetical protein
VAGGFALAVVGMAMWCRHSTKSERRTAAKVLLGFGGVTFFMAMLGHIFLNLVIIAIPSLLVGIVVWLVPGVEPHV